MIKKLLITLTVLFAANYASAVISFNQAVNYPPSPPYPDRPFSIVTANLDPRNNNTNLDLAVVNYGAPYNVSILIGDGLGGFTTPAPTYPAGTAPRSICSGNFNNKTDSYIDLAVADEGSPCGVTVLTNDGYGAFMPVPIPFAAGSSPRSICTADFDGDGNLDLAVANYGIGNISVLLGDGYGAFTPTSPPTFPVRSGPYSVFAADLDNDGAIDLAVANEIDGSVSILKNWADGSGTFYEPTGSPYPAGSGPISVCAADFDDDNYLDLAVANWTGSSTGVSVLINNTSGGFPLPHDFYLVPYSPISVIAADLDGDGDKDLAATTWYNTYVYVLENDGLGGFPWTVNYPVGNGVRSVCAGYFDDDGCLDLATANDNSDNVSVLLNVCDGCLYVLGDINGNVGATALGDYLYGINYHRGCSPPAVQCECPLGSGTWKYPAGDVNNYLLPPPDICVFNSGGDIPYMFRYYWRRATTLRACPDCLPTGLPIGELIDPGGADHIWIGNTSEADITVQCGDSVHLPVIVGNDEFVGGIIASIKVENKFLTLVTPLGGTLAPCVNWDLKGFPQNPDYPPTQPPSQYSTQSMYTMKYKCAPSPTSFLPPSPPITIAFFDLVATYNSGTTFVEFGDANERIPGCAVFCDTNAFEEWNPICHGVWVHIVCDSGEVTGYKFWDKDGDGVWDPGEPGMGGWTITITDGTTIWTVTTGPDGSYHFELPAGTYTISEEQNSHYNQTYPTPPGTHTVVIVADTTLTGYDFGNALSPSGYKMHFPQMPDTLGWDVNATWPKVLADDWLCVESGWIKDLHFWGSWLHGGTGIIDSFLFSLHADIPVSDTAPFSRPGPEIWGCRIPYQNLTVTEINPAYVGDYAEGWFNPNTNQVIPNDHRTFFQYDLNLQRDLWFRQDSGTVYWLNVSAFVHRDTTHSDTLWGWKSSDDHWNDDAVWGDIPSYRWTRMYEPVSSGLYPYIPGDVDYDGDVDANDLSYMTAWLTASGPPPPYSIPNSNPPFYAAADVNGSCVVNGIDAAILSAFLNGGPPLSYCPDYPPQDTFQTLDLSFEVTGDSVESDSGEVTGYKFWDKDGDGVWDPGEPGMGGWTITITDGTTTWTVTTGPDGSYHFELPPGTYTISEEQRSHYNQTYPTSPGTHLVVIVADTTLTGYDFGNALAGGYKMHFPQMPDTLGWDVNATWPKVLADDWMCMETGYIKDLHFWGSWLDGITGIIDSFHLSVHPDIPVSDTAPFSRPGPEIWGYRIPIESVLVTHLISNYIGIYCEGWYNPNTNNVQRNDHVDYYRYDINLPPSRWFRQDSGTVYWLDISAFVHRDSTRSDSLWGWKSSDDHWNDDAVWGDAPSNRWIRMYEPISSNRYPYLPGDVDYDGDVDADDIAYLLAWPGGGPPPPYSIPLSNPTFYPAADPNGNCIMSEVADVVVLMQYLQGGLPPAYCPNYIPQDTLQTLDLAFEVTGDPVEPDTGRISGVKFLDLDKDGIKDSGEPGIGGWTIYITIGGTTWIVTTNPNGTYSIPLPVGTYTVREEHRKDYIQTCPPFAEYTVVVTPNSSIGGINFGNAKAFINQQYYRNNTGQFANDLTKVLRGQWRLIPETDHPFPFDSVYYDPVTNFTYIHWYGAEVHPGDTAAACFTAIYGSGSSIVSSFWTNNDGGKIDDSGPAITVSATRHTDSLDIEVRHDWRRWAGQGWPPLPGDGPGEPFGPVTGSDVYYAITDSARSMEELTPDIFDDPSFQWVPLNGFTIAYGDSVDYIIPGLSEDDIIIFRVILSDEIGNASVDIKQFPLPTSPAPPLRPYVTGDANGNGAFNGLDVTYSVSYFKGGPPPPFSCDCPPHGTWYVAGDVNASCNFNGLDVTYMVTYFKGGPPPHPCADCPPAGR